MLVLLTALAFAIAGLPRVAGAASGPAAPDTLRSAPSAQPAGWSDQPRFVMMRSLLIPGWGQFYNHAYIKAAAVAGGEIWLLATLSTANHDLSQLQVEVDAARESGDAAALASATQAYNDKLDHFVSTQWLLGGVVVYALLDAYVDAHFRHFAVEFRKDSAPPGGPAPARLRLDLRWNF
jgi:hypothetical protein